MGNDEVVVGDELGDIVKKLVVGDELGDIVKKYDLLLEIKPVGDGVNGSLKSSIE